MAASSPERLVLMVSILTATWCGVVILQTPVESVWGMTIASPRLASPRFDTSRFGQGVEDVESCRTARWQCCDDRSRYGSERGDDRDPDTRDRESVEALVVECTHHRPSEERAETDPERRAEQRHDHRLVTNRGSQLRPRHPDGSQETDLARPLEDGE